MGRYDSIHIIPEYYTWRGWTSMYKIPEVMTQGRVGIWSRGWVGIPGFLPQLCSSFQLSATKLSCEALADGSKCLSPCHPHERISSWLLEI